MRGTLAIALFFTSGCPSEELELARIERRPAIEAPPARAPQREEPAGEAAERLPFLGESRDQDAILRALSEGTIEALRPTGTADLVFEARLSNGERARFTPNTRASPRSARAEVASYRIARLAGFDVVPPAVRVRVRVGEVEAKLHPDFRDAWSAMRRELVVEDDWIEGALVHQPFPIRDVGRRPLREAIARLSARGEPEGGFTLLDRDAANLLAFDFLIGNPERMDEPGPYARPAGDRLYFLGQRNALSPDNDPVVTRRALHRIEPIRRASLSFARALDRMDRASIAGVLGDESLLDPEELAALVERRNTLVSLLRAHVDLLGESAVFVFD
jgi:hypothetical protein